MMNEKLGNLVRFEIDRLFNGAVDVDWLRTDPDKATRASVSFVFHGPGTHGVSASVAEGTGHRLIDTASFAADVAANLANPGSRPFTLAIASYGSGKSHLAVTLSELFSNPDKTSAKTILDNMATADAGLSGRVESSLHEIGGRVLVLTVNGMNNADLASVMLTQLKERIAADGHSIEPLESLRQRFQIAATVLGNLSPALSDAFLKDSGISTMEECRSRLLAFDEALYDRAQMFFRTIGQPIKTIGDETVKDVIGRVTDEYIGPNKPYARLLILFDEFGHYLEFAANKPQVAGDGALQHLFEGVQTHADKIAFVGFVQFELEAYQQRLTSLRQNEAKRYVTRYDAAEKYYLSSNLETLVASLLVKTEAPTMTLEDIAPAQDRLTRWYESAKNASSWADASTFLKIASGCWPLSPEAMWVLYYLSSSGRFLQQRSALSLLKAALSEHTNDILGDDRLNLPPVALWTNELHNEFVEMENAAGGSSAIVQSFDAVFERNAQHFSDEEIAVLRSLVLIEQTKLRATDRNDMVDAVAVFSGLGQEEAADCLDDLESEKNVIAWEESFRRFEIFADTGSRAQFRLYLRRKADEYDEGRRATLFIGRAPSLPLIKDGVASTFGDEQNIKTREWDFEPRFTTWALFRLSVANLAAEIRNRSRYQAVSDKRGFVVYCYVSDNETEASVRDEAQRMLRAQCSKVPFMLVLLFDKDHRLSDPLVQLDLLETLGNREKEQFDRLVPVQRRGQEELLEQGLVNAIRERHVLSGVSLPDVPQRLRQFGDAVFKKLFPRVIPFPFDGFTTRGGVSQASKDCAEFTRSLFLTEFGYDATQAMGVQKRNRAQTLFRDAWSVFAEVDGAISIRHPASAVKSLMEEWNKALLSDEGLPLDKALECACAAPYGANIASAALLLAVFFRAHRNAKDIQVMKGSDVVEIDALSASFPDRTTLDPSRFSDVRFIKAVSGEDSPWSDLVDGWSDCISYQAKIDFKQRIDDLRSTHPSIPPALRPKVQEIECGIDVARRRKEDSDNDVYDHLKRIEVATRKEDAYQLAYGASLLSDDLKTRSSQNYLWDPASDIEPLETALRESKQRIVAWFPAWLQSFNPHGETPEAVADFRRDGNDRMGRSLRNLELTDEADQVRRRVERVLQHLEKISDARARKRGAEAWCEIHSTIPQNPSCAQIDAWKNECEKHREALQRSASSMRTINPGIADELSVVCRTLNGIKDQLTRARTSLDSRAGKIYRSILSKESARGILDEIDAVVLLYEGSPKNQEDFRDARLEVNDFIVLAGALSSTETSDDVFRERVERAKVDFVDKFTVLETPWDPQEALDTLVAACERARALESEAWVNRMLEKYADPSGLNAQETIAAQTELARRIPCFNPNDAPRLGAVEKALAKHNDTLGVDLLVEQFNALSPEAQKQFLETVLSSNL